MSDPVNSAGNDQGATPLRLDYTESGSLLHFDAIKDGKRYGLFSVNKRFRQEADAIFNAVNGTDDALTAAREAQQRAEESLQRYTKGEAITDGDLLDRLEAAERLAQERQADAERYQWLRMTPATILFDREMSFVPPFSSAHVYVKMVGNTELDAAIDEARRLSPPTT